MLFQFFPSIALDLFISSSIILGLESEEHITKLTMSFFNHNHAFVRWVLTAFNIVLIETTIVIKIRRFLFFFLRYVIKVVQTMSLKKSVGRLFVCTTSVHFFVIEIAIFAHKMAKSNNKYLYATFLYNTYHKILTRKLFSTISDVGLYDKYKS